MKVMGLLLKAGAAFAMAAIFLGIGPGAPPGLQRLKRDLAATHAESRLASQAQTLFQSGSPHPEGTR